MTSHRVEFGDYLLLSERGTRGVTTTWWGRRLTDDLPVSVVIVPFTGDSVAIASPASRPSST